MEEMLDRQKLLKREDLTGLSQATEEQRKQNQFLDSALHMQEHDQELQESRFSWRFWKKNSRSMEDVKAHMSALVSFMNTEMAENEEQFEVQLAALTKLYENMIEKCEAYLSTHKRTWTDSGKERKRLVKAQLNSAVRDLKVLRVKAYEVRRAAAATDTEEAIIPLWANVLGAIRTTHIDMAKHRTGSTGGNTSDVTILKVKGKKFFFKEDEKLRSPFEEFDRKYIGTSKDKEENKIAAKVRSFLTEDVNNLNTKIFINETVVNKFKSEDPDSWEAGARDIESTLRDMGELDMANALDWEDPTVIEMLHKMLPDYSKWMTRYGVAREAKIDNGSSLSDRNVATSRLAKLLGMEDIVAGSMKVSAEENGEQKGGIIMKEARGLPWDEISEGGKNSVIYTPEAARKLSMLQLFDVLCGQVDRNGGNIFYTAELIKLDNEKPIYRVTDVQGIDNDMSFGKLLWEDITKYKDGNLKLPNPEYGDKCRFPAIDQNMAAAIEALEPAQIKYALKDLLKDDELDALINRLEGIREMLHKYPEVVKPKEAWDDNALMDQYKVGGLQPQNAYLNVDVRSLEHKFIEQNESYRIYVSMKNKLRDEMKEGSPQHKLRKFIRYYGNLTLVAGDYKYMMAMDEEVGKLLFEHMSKSFVDELVKLRFQLTEFLIQRYQHYMKQPIPKNMLVEGDDGESEAAKQEYARLMLKQEQGLTDFESFNLMMGAFPGMEDITEDGETYSPAEYVTMKLNEQTDRDVMGLHMDEVDEIISKIANPARKYKHIKKDLVEAAEVTKQKTKEEQAMDMVREAVGQAVKLED